ncbi:MULTISPECIES: glycosyltransferase family 4 protein [Colwellia]|uniref:Glycosyl transferase n=1 Tax=Colwellia marinimaniae TaxID=1513592 RepID=A0ABQ0MYF4_9GAMM|nr:MULTISPECIES: glycosyltransferase family 4 protein [Colwellia]GAW97410.1 glycosyl transferase [Colwellia marinimaniae]
MAAKTLTIALLLDSRNYGGIETHVVNLARGLHKSGHNVQIILLNNYGKHPVFESDKFLRSILVKLDGNPATLYKLIKYSAINLVHTHGYKAGIIGRLTGKLANKAVVSTFHSGEQGSIKIRLYRWLDRMTAHYSPCICVSKQIKKSANLTAEVIENFVELPEKTLTETTLASQIAFVGRLSYEKGPDLFLRLAEQLPQYQFSIYGNGPMLKEISMAATNNVMLMGHVNSMQQHWCKINLLCITSREEGLPLVALEALVRGIPVISYDIGGISAVVINNINGWLIPPLNEVAFIDAVKQGQMLSSEQRKKMSWSAYQHIKNNFSSHAIIPQIFKVYRKALIGGSHEH